jgi:hypothetical protein
MRRLILFAVAGVFAVAATTANASPDLLKVWFDDEGNVCYYSGAIPMAPQCRPLLP